MAKLLWGQVYFKENYAGILQQEPGERVSFTYDKSYLEDKKPAISYTLPLREEPYISHMGLHPFFDNLIAEGWLEHAQLRVLGKRDVSRFELLLTFGYDCPGAVFVVDPDPVRLSEKQIDLTDPKELAVFTSRASLSGIQPKLAVREEKGKYYPTAAGELSTHIAKFPSSTHNDLRLLNMYMVLQSQF